MNKWIAGLVVSAVFSGCGVDAGEAEGVATQREAVISKGAMFPTPYIPATPKAYHPKKTVLYTTKIKSAYTATARSDTNSNLFYAWGFDVYSRECVFHVVGEMSDYSDFQDDVEAVLKSVPMNNPTYVGSGGQGQVGKPRGPGPIGGGDLWVDAYRFF